MKKTGLLLFVIFTLITCELFAQEKVYEFEFKDGETKSIIMDYDDPYKLSKLHVAVFFPICFGKFGPNSFGPTIAIKPDFRYNDKWSFDALFNYNYVNLDDNAPNIKNAKVSSAAFNIAVMAHYSFSNILKTKEKKTSIDYGYSGRNTTIYTAKIPRTCRYSFEADGGFEMIRSNALADLEDANHASEFTPYHAFGMSYYSLVAGVSIYKSESYKMNTNGTKRAYSSYSRLYLDGTFALAGSYNSYNDNIGLTGSGFVAPDLNRLGWRLGWDKRMSIMNSGTSLAFGIEFGQSPTFNFNTDYLGGLNIFMLRFGFCFGRCIDK